MSSRVLLIVLAGTATATAADFPRPVIARVYDELVPSICLVTYSLEVTNPASGKTSRRDNSALGLIVAADGLVMTPGHMELENAESFNIRVTVGQGSAEKKYDAVLLKKPSDVNVCFLRLSSEEPLALPVVHFTPGLELELGQPLLIMGVLSETLDFNRGISTVRVGAIIEEPRTTYCLDRSVRYGFVGGPVVDAQGRLAGVVGFDLTPSEGGDLYVRSGHPLVYQAALFEKYIEEPPSDEADPEDGWLGVFTQPLTDDLAEYWGLAPNGGVVVSTVVAGSPAHSAALRPGDVIVRFNDVAIRVKHDQEVRGFTKLVRESGIGDTVPIELLRDGETVHMEIALGARPKSASDAGEYEDEVFGLTVREITTDIRILLNLSEDVKGVIVSRVKSGSVAALAGMRPGIIILDLGSHSVGNLDDFVRAVDTLAAEQPKEISAFCRAGGATGFFRLKPRWEKQE